MNQDRKTLERYYPITGNDTVLKYGSFSISVPGSWKMPNDDTLIQVTDATAVGRIQIGENEFIWYSYGLSASDWSEYPIVISDTMREVFLRYEVDTSYVIFTDGNQLVDSSRLRIHEIWYDTISNYQAKLFRPLKPGYGYTGIYIDSVSELPGIAKVNFAIHADLDSIRGAALIKALKTIQLKPWN